MEVCCDSAARKIRDVVPLSFLVALWVAGPAEGQIDPPYYEPWPSKVNLFENGQFELLSTGSDPDSVLFWYYNYQGQHLTNIYRHDQTTAKIRFLADQQDPKSPAGGNVIWMEGGMGPEEFLAYRADLRPDPNGDSHAFALQWADEITGEGSPVSLSLLREG